MSLLCILPRVRITNETQNTSSQESLGQRDLSWLPHWRELFHFRTTTTEFTLQSESFPHHDRDSGMTHAGKKAVFIPDSGGCLSQSLDSFLLNHVDLDLLQSDGSLYLFKTIPPDRTQGNESGSPYLVDSAQGNASKEESTDFDALLINFFNDPRHTTRFMQNSGWTADLEWGVSSSLNSAVEVKKPLALRPFKYKTGWHYAAFKAKGLEPNLSSQGYVLLFPAPHQLPSSRALVTTTDAPFSWDTGLPQLHLVYKYVTDSSNGYERGCMTI